MNKKTALFLSTGFGVGYSPIFPGTLGTFLAIPIFYFFSDIKFPKSKRHSLPLLFADQELIWVTGIRPTDKYKITKKTKNVLKISISIISRFA